MKSNKMKSNKNQIKNNTLCKAFMKSEFIRDVNMKGGWEVDFTEAIKKMKLRQKYDEIWEKIKKDNNW